VIGHSSSTLAASFSIVYSLKILEEDAEAIFKDQEPGLKTPQFQS